MIRIAILDQSSYLLDKLDSNLQQQGFAATTALDGENLSAWLAKHGIDMLVLRLPNDTQPATPTPISKPKPELLSGNQPACWRLNSSQLELITPDGRPIPLSHNECCVLGAAAKANGSLISRKMLIEALGQNFWHYDERRLESLISRLRRKLASHTQENFPIRGVKGQGYLFGVELQVLEIC
ncbi:MAG: winged helix-turn-helix domain-containing protein [Methylobacter sp.]|jgi:DNA-binding response OmpR family regulator|nr:winged helix-turn-helix domain-containing protein [Methylobacter sp.]